MSSFRSKLSDNQPIVPHNFLEYRSTILVQPHGFKLPRASKAGSREHYPDEMESDSNNPQNYYNDEDGARFTYQPPALPDYLPLAPFDSSLKTQASKESHLPPKLDSYLPPTLLDPLPSRTQSNIYSPPKLGKCI